jgi:SAM-dependent methyltransferase
MSAIHAVSLAQVDTGIRTQPCPNCYLCNTAGEILYENLADRLFGTAGSWTLRKCPALACGTVWLDPMPTEEDIGNAYATYYTHGEPLPRVDSANRSNFLGRALRGLYKTLLTVTSVRAEREQLASMYLADVAPGRVLDVGCGDGSRLALLQKLGWQVAGQEMDPQAAASACKHYGIRVHLGPLGQAEFAAGEFDAIIMSHVVEHLHDPISVFAQCKRLLRTGGTFIVVTPNIESCGHRYFRSEWMGLDPPRHLHLFSERTLLELAKRSGFGRVETWTTPANAGVFANGSLGIRAAGNRTSRFAAKAGFDPRPLQYQWRWYLVHLKDRSSGEECVLRATK